MAEKAKEMAYDAADVQNERWSDDGPARRTRCSSLVYREFCKLWAFTGRYYVPFNGYEGWV